MGITKLASLEELSKLPFTTKNDLRHNFPYGFLAVDMKDVVRLHSSSGTTGIPTVVFHTKDDIENWSSLVARSMYMAGVRHGDVFKILWDTVFYGWNRFSLWL